MQISTILERPPPVPKLSVIGSACVFMESEGRGRCWGCTVAMYILSTNATYPVPLFDYVSLVMS